MKLSNVTRTTVLALLALVLVTGAYADSKYGSYSTSFGNSNAGGSVYAYGQLYTSSSYAKAYGKVSGTLKLFGKSVEAGRAEAKAYQYTSSSSGSATLKIAGVTVWSTSLSTSGYKYKSIQLNAFNPSPSITVWVGPVPVTASGNVGAGAKLSVSYSFSVYYLSAALNGSVSGWGYGSVYAGLGVKGYSLGVSTELQFGNQTISLGAKASIKNGLSGYMKYTLTPLELVIKFVVKAWPFTWSKTLAKYKYDSYTKYFMQ